MMTNPLDIPFTITNIDNICPTDIQIHFNSEFITKENYHWYLISKDNKTYEKLLEKYPLKSTENYYGVRIVDIKLKPKGSIYLKYDNPKKIKELFDFPINRILITNGKTKLSGNINSLIFTDYSNTRLTIPRDIFKNLFSPIGLIDISDHYISTIDASDLLLGKRILNKCYAGMFAYNTKLKYPPKVLPAKQVPDYSYNSMFHGCTNLISIPDIKGEVFHPSSCADMFEDCVNLKNIHNFPKNIKLACGYSFSSMFNNCPLEVFPKKLNIKYSFERACHTMFYFLKDNKDIPLDFLLSLNLNVYTPIAAGPCSDDFIPKAKHIYQYMIKDLKISAFQKKISVFNFYGQFS